VDDGRRLIALKRADVCCACASNLPSGFRAYWDFYARTTTCLDCGGPMRDDELERIKSRAQPRRRIQNASE
jgi:hypothetical protein